MSGASTATRVELEGLTVRFGDLVAVREIGFRVERGEMFGLIGPDGAGKTTTLRVVLGLLSPQSGRVRTCGLDPRRERRTLSGRVGYLSQRFSLYGDLSIDENVAFFARVHGVRGWKARRDELLDLLRLEPFRGRQAERLSGGMKQKLALACTLIHTPELLVLDEPTTGVDPVSRREFWKLLSQFLAAGITVLMSTPYLDEAERCARIALLHEGRLLALDEPGRLRASLPGTWVELIVPSAREALGALPFRAQLFGDRLHLWLDETDEAKALRDVREAAAARGVPVTGLRRIEPSLEDVFIEKLKGTDA